MVKHFRQRLADAGGRHKGGGFDWKVTAEERLLPKRSGVPVVAQRWHPKDAALFLITLGRYNPDLHGCAKEIHEHS